MNQLIGHIITTYRPSQLQWEPFKRTTMPMMWPTAESLQSELEQVRLNYPGQQFKPAMVVMDLSS